MTRLSKGTEHMPVVKRRWLAAGPVAPTAKASPEFAHASKPGRRCVRILCGSCPDRSCRPTRRSHRDQLRSLVAQSSTARSTSEQAPRRTHEEIPTEDEKTHRDEISQTARTARTERSKRRAQWTSRSEADRKYEEQQLSVRNNREYDAPQKEIETHPTPHLIGHEELEKPEASQRSEESPRSDERRGHRRTPSREEDGARARDRGRPRTSRNASGAARRGRQRDSERTSRLRGLRTRPARGVSGLDRARLGDGHLVPPSGRVRSAARPVIVRSTPAAI